MQRNKKTIRKGNRQKAWQYMRRNPMFAIKDILLVLGMSEKSLMMLVRQLVNDGYLRQMGGSHVFKERTYKLIKNTGVICPRWIEKQKKLFDENIKVFGLKDPKYIPKESKKIEQRPIHQEEYDKGRIVQILQAENKGLGINSLKNRSGVSLACFNKALESLQGDGVVMVESGIYRMSEVSDDS